MNERANERRNAIRKDASERCRNAEIFTRQNYNYEALQARVSV